MFILMSGFSGAAASFFAVDGVKVVDLFEQKLLHVFERHIVNGGGHFFDEGVENLLCAEVADLFFKVVEIEFSNGPAELRLLLFFEFDFHGAIQSQSGNRG